MSEVLVQLNDGVGELILNRPKQRNALTGPLVHGLIQNLDDLLSDSKCRAIVIRGAEGFFCAGLDLKAFSANPAPEWRASFQSDWASYHEKIYQADIPIIGAVEGFAIAGGSSLALSCDFLIMGESSFMHVSEVERNMLAPLNVFWLTQRHSYQVALRMGLLGERWKAADLVQQGIAEKVVPDDQVVSSAIEMASRFAGFDTNNVRGLKRSIRLGAQTQSDFSVASAVELIKSGATAV